MATLAEFDIDAELEAERKAEQERLLKLQQELAALDAPAPRVESESLGRYYGPMAGEPMARSFINANTSALGETIETGRNDDVTDVKAIRLQGQNEFNNLVKGGVAPADALAQTAGKIYYSDPAAMVRAINPRTRAVAPKMAAPVKATVPKMPEDVKVGQKLIEKNIDDLRKQINTDYNLNAKEENIEAQRRIIKNRETLAQLEEQMQQGSTNWSPQAKAPSVPPAPFQMKTMDESGPEGLAMRQIPVARVSEPAQQVSGVERKTPSGRIAIFDGATKKFLRWK